MSSLRALLVLLAASAVVGCAAPAPEYVYVLPEEASAAPRAAASEAVRPRPSATARPARDRSAIDQSSPLAALESFVQAYRARRWDLVMRFIPDAELEGDGGALTEEKLRTAWEGTMREEMDRVVANLEEALAAGLAPELSENGELATLHFKAMTVSLVREGGVWRIRDFG